MNLKSFRIEKSKIFKDLLKNWVLFTHSNIWSKKQKIPFEPGNLRSNEPFHLMIGLFNVTFIDFAFGSTSNLDVYFSPLNHTS